MNLLRCKSSIFVRNFAHKFNISTLNKIKECSQFKLPNFQESLAFDVSKLNQSQSTLKTIENANITYHSLNTLLAKRIQTLFSLNYITLLNPNMAKILNAYLESYALLSKFNNECPQITTTDENQQFVQILEEIMLMHTDNVIDLRNGIKECQSSFPDENGFLNNHLSERILMRLITNNHILVTKEQRGILNQTMDVLKVLENSIDFINNLTELKYYEKININVTALKHDTLKNTYEPADSLIFPYFENHLEYILNEILKNSARSTIENDKLSHPLQILLVLSHSKDSLPYLQIKISDKAGGIHPEVMPNLWDYSFTTVKSGNESDSSEDAFTSSVKDNQLGATTDLGIDTNVGDNIIAGMGYGLPLSLTYAKLFHGDIKVHSVFGKGTDVYIILRNVETLLT